MPEPIDELRNFEPGEAVKPMPAAEIRRLGDRRRRRTTAFAVGGAVAAIALIATPIAVISGGDDGGDVAPADTSLTDEVLLTADEVPARDRLTAWTEVPEEGRTLACAPAPPAALDAESSVRRDFGAHIAGTPAGEIPSSIVRTEVLQFADPETAREQYDQAQRWVLGCPGGENVARKGVQTRSIGIEDGRGEWRQHEFYAPDICTECDAIRFDRMGVAQFGDRVVLMSLAEVGGPLEPEDLDASMAELFAAAVEKAGGVLSDDSAISTIPDGFPLAEGLTSDGQEGPSRDLDIAPYNLEGAVSACGTFRSDLPAAVDTLYAGSRTPSRGHLRQLMVFGSGEEAQAFASGVAELFADCPEDEDGRGVSKTYTVSEESGFGDFAASSVMRIELDGQPAPGARIVQVVRVGNSVLLTLVNDEGTTLTGEDDAFGFGYQVLQAAGPVIEAMSDL